jgi:hypothetical protein
MASLKLTVSTGEGRPPLHVSVNTDTIVALGPAAGGGCMVRIPTREIAVIEDMDAVLLAWLGPNNGCPDAPAAAAGD